MSHYLKPKPARIKDLNIELRRLHEKRREFDNPALYAERIKILNRDLRRLRV